MPRAKKDAVVLNVKLATPVHRQLEEFCQETGLSKTLATEKIFAHFFEGYFKQPESKRKIF